MVYMIKIPDKINATIDLINKTNSFNFSINFDLFENKIKIHL